MKHAVRVLISCFVLLIPCLPGQAGAQDAERHVRLSLMPERSPVKAGETIMIGIEQAIEPGWHTYWANPGDSGEPMRIKWDLPPGAMMSDIRWPVPHTIKIGPMVNYGFNDRVVLFQELTLPDPLPKGPIVLRAKTETLVCKEICIPEHDDLTLTLNDGHDVDNSTLFDQAVNDLPSEISSIWDARYSETRDGLFEIRMKMVDPRIIAPGGGPAQIGFIPYDWGVIQYPGAADIKVDKDNVLVIRKARGDRSLDDLDMVRGVLVYNDEKGRRSGLLIEAKPDQQWLAQKKNPDAGSAPETLKSSAAAEDAPRAPMPAIAALTGLPAALLLALMGGIILNLMPCVFPVLSMKALSLVKMSEKGESHARLYGVTYTAGILACFILIGTALMILIAGGARIGWGFQMQNPLVVLLLSWLLFVIGLNFSGLFEISGSFSNVGAGLARREGVKGSFFTGMLAALVATPCTAPFMGTAMGYALTRPPAAALSVFVAMGVGLALPYLLICFVPALRGMLPKPGPWMRTLREFFAFPMYASAAWLAWVYARQAGLNGMLTSLGGMVLLGALFWLSQRMPERGRPARIALALPFGCLIVLGLAGLAWTAVDAHAGRTRAQTEGAAAPFTPAALKDALAGDAPVFVNMTAAWCITCKINEIAALDSHEVKALFRDLRVRYLKGDWTSQDPDITAFLARFGRNGVPLYVYYGPRAASGDRPDPVVLPQILTPSVVRSSLSPQP